MKRSYSCRHCGGLLNPNVKIILRGQLAGQAGLFLFSPQPGNYHVIVPDGFGLRKKDAVAFSCPICGRDLTSRRDRSLAEIAVTSPTGACGTVAFSRTFGVHATYVITEESVRSYGEHATARGVNFWGVGPPP